MKETQDDLQESYPVTKHDKIGLTYNTFFKKIHSEQKNWLVLI